MKPSVRESFAVCLSLAYGLFIGLILFFCGRAQWITKDFVSTAALFVANVLFSALVMGFIGGALLSIFVFPLQYFVIKKFSRIVSATFFVVGFAIGSIFLKAAIIKFG